MTLRKTITGTMMALAMTVGSVAVAATRYRIGSNARTRRGHKSMPTGTAVGRTGCLRTCRR
jgi:hypothetical protein